MVGRITPRSPQLQARLTAAGDSGEFYTPHAVVRLMVAVLDPRLGETVLALACGAGGFLVEAFNHLSKQVKTVADRRVLQEHSLFGCEPKSLPYPYLCRRSAAFRPQKRAVWTGRANIRTTFF